jgi:hypothetical protein
MTDEKIRQLHNRCVELKQLILSMSEHFSSCSIDQDSMQILLHTIDSIRFYEQEFNRNNQKKIQQLAIQQDLSIKSHRDDIIQLKNYVDQQIGKLIELNKHNADQLQQLKFIQSATDETRRLQTNISKRSRSYGNVKHRSFSYPSSRPYITFELDHIRKYQRQAFVHLSNGTIPLYRRQAWVDT